MKSPFIKLLLAPALLIKLSACIVLPQAIDRDWGEGVENFTPAQLLSNASGRYDHWQSIGRVEIANGMTCSGALIDTRQATDEQDSPAYVLTSGHCANLNPNVVVEDAVATGRVIFNFFQDTSEHTKSYPVSRINWSTIRGQDISIIQLDRTISQLISDGIQPLEIATHLPTNVDLLIVGAPQQRHIQRMACPREHSTGVVENPWSWLNQISNRCQDVVSGISGSPLLGRYNNEIIAVVGTTTQGSGQARCSQGAPCEVVDGQVSKKLNTNYATPAIGLLACFNKGHFDRLNGSCTLGPNFTFAATPPTNTFIKLERDPSGQVIPWLWIQPFAVNRPYYQYKFTRTLDECGASGGYSEAIVSNTSGENELRRELHDGAGMYLLCVMGQDQKIGAPGQWDARNARIYWRWMMEGPNKLAPIFSINQSPHDPSLYEVRAFPVSPDLDAYSYQYKVGSSENTDCLDAQDYVKLQPSIGIFEVDVKNGPMKVCLKTKDLAGNPSPISDFRLPE
ncbi:trypsin-like serine peptidase [Pseudomonas sp. LB3P14]